MKLNELAPAEGSHKKRMRVGRGEDRAEHLDRKLLGERGDREREQRRAAHREDVVERVRRSDCSVVGGVVDDRREKVEREDDRPLVVDMARALMMRALPLPGPEVTPPDTIDALLTGDLMTMPDHGAVTTGSAGSGA